MQNQNKLKNYSITAVLVGRRFRLAHILFGRDVIEVATFRGHHAERTKPADSPSNQMAACYCVIMFTATISEDAERRDFTVNALVLQHRRPCGI